MTEQRKALYRADEVAEMLDQSRHTIYKPIRSGRLPAIVLPGGRLRIRREEVERILTPRKAGISG